MIRGRPVSLAGRLFLRVMLLIAAIGLAMAAVTFWVASREINRESDTQLTSAANVFYALMHDELDVRSNGGRVLTFDDRLLSGEDLRGFRASADWRMFAVWRDGRRVLQSDTAPPDLRPPERPGFATVSLASGEWRLYGLPVPEARLMIQVGERVSVRNRLIADVAKSLVAPLAMLMAGSAVLLWLSLSDGLLQLRRLGESVGQRGPRSTLRFAAGDWPRELAPLVITINDLLDRVDAAIERERQFTDDAAHQLRTPLATLKLQLQGLRRRALLPDPSILAPLLETTDRASQLVGQMLTLARLEGGEAFGGETIDLAERIRGCMADQAPFAAQRGVELAFEDGGGAMARTNGTAIDLILSNLIENAVKHVPAGSSVTVTLLADEPDRVEIAITDDGPGIPPSERAAVLRRFHRGTESGTGAGLGLAIVASAVALIGGELALEDGLAGRGLRALIAIPR